MSSMATMAAVTVLWGKILFKVEAEFEDIDWV
jgi:hypothetical protein